MVQLVTGAEPSKVPLCSISTLKRYAFEGTAPVRREEKIKTKDNICNLCLETVGLRKATMLTVKVSDLALLMMLLYPQMLTYTHTHTCSCFETDLLFFLKSQS